MGETVMAQAQVGNYFDDVESKKQPAKTGNYFDESNKYEKMGRNLPSPAQGAINAVSSGLLGFGDELYGALGGLGALVTGNNVKDAYIENRDIVRGAQKQYQEDYPKTALITGMMAGAPLMAYSPVKTPSLPIATTKLEAAKNVAKLANYAGKTGAAYGAAYGAGASEGENIQDVASDALKGGAVGYATGAIAQPVLSGVGALGKNAAIRMFGDVQNTRAINQTGGQAGAIDPLSGLTDKAKQWVKQQGDVKIAEAIEQTGRARLKNQNTPYSEVLSARVDKMPVNTPLAALSGAKSNELRSLDALATLSGRTSPAVADVQDRLATTASKRFLNYADKVLAGGKPDFNKSIAALETRAKVESKPFYDVLQTVNVPIDDEVRNLVTRAGRYASKANQMARLEGEDFTDIVRYVNPESGATQIPLMQLERLKRAMNGAIGTAKASGDAEFARSLLAAKNALTQKLESVSPVTPQGESVYRLANQKFAEPKQLIEAVEEGANIFKKNHMDIRDYKATLNEPQRQAFEIGVFRALEQKMGTPSGRNFLTEISKDRNTSRSLLEALGKERFKQLAYMMKGEKALKSIYGVNTGSQTAQRQAALSELGLDPLSDASESMAHLMVGNPLSAVGKAGVFWNKISTPEQVRDYMGQQYLLTGKQSQDYLKTLNDLIKQIEQQKLQGANRLGTFGALGTGTPKQDKK